MSTPATPPGPASPASPSPSRRRRLSNNWRAGIGLIVLLIVAAILVGAIYIGNDGKQLGGVTPTAPVDTSNAPPVPSISATPTPTPTPSVSVTPSSTPVSTPTTTKTAAKPVASCPPFNPMDVIPPRTLEAAVTTAGRQRAACDFAAVWQYEAARPTIRSPKDTYAQALAVCKSKVRGETMITRLGPAYRTDARAFYVAAVRTLCPGHDKKPIRTVLDTKARALQLAVADAAISWTPGNAYGGRPPSQEWVYGQFLKAACPLIRRDSSPDEIQGALRGQENTLRLMSFDHPDDAALKIYIDAVTGIGCTGI